MPLATSRSTALRSRPLAFTSRLLSAKLPSLRATCSRAQATGRSRESDVLLLLGSLAPFKRCARPVRPLLLGSCFLSVKSVTGSTTRAKIASQLVSLAGPSSAFPRFLRRKPTSQLADLQLALILRSSGAGADVLHTMRILLERSAVPSCSGGARGSAARTRPSQARRRRRASLPEPPAQSYLESSHTGRLGMEAAEGTEPRTRSAQTSSSSR